MINKENVFQASLIRTIKNMLPGCIVLKLDPNYMQGIPDLLILHGLAWAALECKKSENAPHQPNQDFYVNKMNRMSFAAFIYPENIQQVLQDMIAHINRINTMTFTQSDLEDWRNSQSDLNLLMNSNRYEQINQA